jgi:hypothetical protein
MPWGTVWGPEPYCNPGLWLYFSFVSLWLVDSSCPPVFISSFVLVSHFLSLCPEPFSAYLQVTAISVTTSGLADIQRYSQYPTGSDEVWWLVVGWSVCSQS